MQKKMKRQMQKRHRETTPIKSFEKTLRMQGE
jgi:hypothetical protein